MDTLDRQQHSQPLTARELDILLLLSQGLSTQEIAHRLYLSIQTVNLDTHSIYRKLGKADRAGAIARAQHLGLFDFGLAPSPLPEAKHNLPLPITTFVGREVELTELGHLLDNASVRLVTIVGPGGTGKTRLALEAATRQIERYRHGVFLVSLASLEAFEQLPLAIADALGFSFYNASDLNRQLLSYFHQKQILLVMDSFEHLLSGAGIVSEILEAAPEVKILSTSREALNLQGEWRYEIKGLAYPQDDLAPVTEAQSGLQLFAERASQANQEFSLVAEQSHVIQLCRLVEGLPLALELAAGWLRILSCRELVAEITRSLDFLTTTQRDVPVRHRSVRAVFEHSWILLSTEQQQALAQLSVFRGAFSREAAACVAGMSLGTLLALVDKSLLSVDAGDRYRFHELVRHFSDEKLCQAPQEKEAAERRHATYYADFLYSRIQDMGEERQDHMAAIEEEFGNVQSGWRWSTAHGEASLIEKYVLGFWHFYNRRGWYWAGSSAIDGYVTAIRQLTNKAIDASSLSNVVSCVYASLGEIFLLLGRRKEALQGCQHALQNLQLAASVWQARLYRQMGNLYRLGSQHAAAAEAYLQAETVLGKEPLGMETAWWEEWIQIRLEQMWGFYWSGQWPEMGVLGEQLQTPIEKYGTLNQQINYYQALAAMHMRRSRWVVSDEILANSRSALALSLQSRNKSNIAWSQFIYGMGLLWSANYDEAEQLMQSALSLAEQNGDIVHQARCLTYLTMVYRKREQLDAVRRYAAQSLAAATTAQMPEYVGTAKANLAWIAWCEGHLHQVEAYGRAALEHWRQLGPGHPSAIIQWTALWPLLATALVREDLAQAVEYARALLDPNQQRLPDNLATCLDDAIRAWEQGESQPVYLQLHQACVLAGIISDPNAGASTVASQLLFEPLTERELDVLRLLAKGVSNRQIANQLCVAVSTVQTHLKGIYGKLDVHNRSQAILLAKELELV